MSKDKRKHKVLTQTSSLASPFFICSLYTGSPQPVSGLYYTPNFFTHKYKLQVTILTREQETYLNTQLSVATYKLADYGWKVWRVYKQSNSTTTLMHDDVLHCLPQDEPGELALHSLMKPSSHQHHNPSHSSSIIFFSYSFTRAQQ